MWSLNCRFSNNMVLILFPFDKESHIRSEYQAKRGKSILDLHPEVVRLVTASKWAAKTAS